MVRRGVGEHADAISIVLAAIIMPYGAGATTSTLGIIVFESLVILLIVVVVVVLFTGKAFLRSMLSLHSPKLWGALTKDLCPQSFVL